MCGIFGYLGNKKAIETVLDGLERLSYRGYDSAGIAFIQNHKLVSYKESGKLSVLAKAIDRDNPSNITATIGHTRWATHGVPDKINAHPHFDAKKTLALVHNGIVENHRILRELLLKEGVSFTSDTDTEVVAQLIGHFYQDNLVEAVKKAIAMIQGTYAIALVHQDYPDQIIAFANHSPLVIGVGDGECFLASDSHAFSPYTQEVLYLENGEMAILKANHLQLFNKLGIAINKKSQILSYSNEDSGKGSFEHYTLKEIYYQPKAVEKALAFRIFPTEGMVHFEELNLDPNELLGVERILILACGTSWHAGLIGAGMLEEKARIPVQVDISSEFRYKNPIIPHGTFVIAISQSGETADTIAAIHEARAKGARVLSLCNVTNSTIVRESDVSLQLKAGPEIGVCSTKAFTSQVVLLSLFTILMARMRHMSKQEGQEAIHALRMLPDQIQAVLDNSDEIKAIAKKYAMYDNFFYIGRRYMFPTSLEGALKLKEISYINANGYAAGEMKHGPIALLNPKCPVVAATANKSTFNKILSNLSEVKSRLAPLIAIAEEGSWTEQAKLIADDVISVPETSDELAAIPTTVAMQLLAYYIAKERGSDIDQPRNLAKSVTVE